MTQQEAIALARTGVKVTHKHFDDNEYITIEDDKVIDEQGYRLDFFSFFLHRIKMVDGWELYKPYEHE